MSRRHPKSSTSPKSPGESAPDSYRSVSYSTSGGYHGASQRQGDGHTDERPPHQPNNGQDSYPPHQQPRYYEPTSRSWDRINPEVYQAISNPALNHQPSSSSSEVHSSAGQHSHQPHPSHQPQPQYDPYSSATHQGGRRLNASDLERHQYQQQPTSGLSEWEKSNPRNGQYDAVGYVEYGSRGYDYRAGSSR